jgi:transcriptional regulator
MYTPPLFAVTGQDQLDQILENAGLGCLITHGPDGLFASHLPFVHDAADHRLRGHLAMANPHRRMAGGGEALVVFQGVDAYISPGFYPSKAEHGKVVPTWNYEAVHVHGRLVWHEDAAWLRANVAALTDRFERGRQDPWSIEDAPEPYIDAMLGAIVGVELRITRVEAKRKLSQNRNAADRAGVIEGLAACPGHGAQAMAQTMANLGMKDR